MDKPHQQVVTTYPVAIKEGQGRIHVPASDIIPWHHASEKIKCPNCESTYIVNTEYPKVDFLAALERHHKNNQEHPDYVASAPEWTRLEDCTCGS